MPSFGEGAITSIDHILVSLLLNACNDDTDVLIMSSWCGKLVRQTGCGLYLLLVFPYTMDTFVVGHSGKDLYIPHP